MSHLLKITNRVCGGLSGLWLLILLAASPALAGDGKTGRELRLGLLAHSAGLISDGTESGSDINLELLMAQNPRLHPLFGRMVFGVNLNMNNETSLIYAGRSWQYRLPWSFAIEYQFGGALHDGKLNTEDVDRRQLGSRFLFRNALELGWCWEIYRISVIYDHSSNAGWFSKRNQGLDNVGMRLSVGI